MDDSRGRQLTPSKAGLISTDSTSSGLSGPERPQSVRFRSKDEVYHYKKNERVSAMPAGQPHTKAPLPQPGISTQSNSAMYRLGGTLVLLAAALILLRHGPASGGHATLPLQVVEGGVIPEEALSRTGPILGPRDDSPTDVCFRWAQQSAVVNGTLYLYGGQSTTTESQTQNTWNNDLLTLDLTKTWQIANPSLAGLPQPSGPPAVSLGYLWNSYDSLYVYGGEFSDKPETSPSPLSTWEYQIQSQQWQEHSNPTTSSGKGAPDDQTPVQRAAEGAGVSVPSLGRGFYFGGHQDVWTTPGWYIGVARIYLQSLLEFTFPGHKNTQVNALSNGQDAGTDGNYRNITRGGLQSTSGFTNRADGLLVYIPGFGEEGILLALAGGTNMTYTQMNSIDVYDIANSTWYKQSTSGPTPDLRVNPCAVVTAAPDGSSYNIAMFGGQALLPYGNQTQFQDMWVLTLPSFTWIEVDQTGQSVPYGRSGHTCNAWDGQMVMVGGYVGDQLSCESPGIYVYDLSNLQWVQQFTALSVGASGGSAATSSAASSSGSSAGSASGDSSTFNSTGANNPLNQQPAQISNASFVGGLEGSYGYTVPQVIIDIIGGSKDGGATVTAPVVTATGGPLATGKPITYTVAGPNGAVVTETGTPGNGTTSSTASNDGKAGPNIAAIVAGSIAGLLFIIACYLAFCAYVYRKQLQLYKQHVEMSQRQARGEKVPAIAGLLPTDSAKNSYDRRADGTLLPTSTEGDSQHGSYGGYSGGQTSSQGRAPALVRPGYQSVRRESDRSSTDDLLQGSEPTFVGVLLNPRRSLKVVNRD